MEGAGEEAKNKMQQEIEGSRIFLNWGEVGDMFKEKLLWLCGNDFVTQGFTAIQQRSNYLAGFWLTVIWLKVLMLLFIFPIYQVMMMMMMLMVMMMVMMIFAALSNVLTSTHQKGRVLVLSRFLVLL